MGRRETLVALRLHVGHTQETLATAVGTTPRNVRRWESGENTPRPYMRRLLATELQCEITELSALLVDTDATGESGHPTSPPHFALASTSHETQSSEDMNRRKLLASSAAIAATLLIDDQHETRHVGRSDISRIAATTQLYRSLDSKVGGGQVYESLVTASRAASTLARIRCDERLRPDVLSAISELRVLTGWTAMDAGLHYDANQHFSAAKELALDAKNHDLAAFIAYCQARQLQHQRRNRSAIAVLDAPWMNSSVSLSPGTIAMVQATTAPSLAALDDFPAAIKLLERARDNYERIDVVNEPTWLQWMSEAELTAQYGRVYRDYARCDRSQADKAVYWTNKALGAFEGGHERSSALNQVGLCSALLLAGELDEALTIAEQIPQELTDITSTRLRDRVAALPRDASDHLHHSEIADFAQAMTIAGSTHS